MANPESIKGKGFDVNPQNINRNGKPKKINRVIQDHFLAEHNVKLSNSQINEVIMSMFSKTIAELSELQKLEDTPAWIKLLINKFNSDSKKGSLDSLNFIFDRGIGKALQKEEKRVVDNNGNDVIPNIIINGNSDNQRILE